MAVEVTSDAWELLDPFAGAVDLERRRLRILHPLSFVEDPTRLLRAARYAARLDLRPDAWTARCQALALSLAPYAALSAQRIATDLERLLAESRCAEALAVLARGGVPRLLDHALSEPAIPPGHSGRLEIAQWLTDPRNPLPSRVMVNRIWHWHFGRGIVATINR